MFKIYMNNNIIIGTFRIEKKGKTAMQRDFSLPTCTITNAIAITTAGRHTMPADKMPVQLQSVLDKVCKLQSPKVLVSSPDPSNGYEATKGTADTSSAVTISDSQYPSITIT